MKAEIIEASPIEWGLVIDGQGVRTWWKSSFLGKPDLEHPKVKEALQAHAELMKMGIPTQDDPGAYPTT